MQRGSAALDLDVQLPPGWMEHPNPGGSRQYRARADGKTGLLQVSMLPNDQFELVANQADLGAVAAGIGKRLGSAGQNWGTPQASSQGICTMGRFGLAMFQDGLYPAMLLWVTVSDRAAWLWMWLGPNPVADEVKQAMRVVRDAQERTRTS